MDFIELFKKQAHLNDLVFQKMRERGVDAPSVAQFQDPSCPPEVRRQWVLNYLRALQHETIEAEDSMCWKWWLRDPQDDLQNLTVELVDILFFLLSACLAANVSPETLFSVYEQKLLVNLQRQEAGYSKATKTEDDNLTIKTQ